MMMMQMTFYQSVHVSLWFDAWTSDSLLTYVVLLMGVSAFAVGHEGLHRFRQACSLVSRLPTSPQMPGSSLEGVSSTPLLQAARATSKRRLEKAADVVMKECGTLAVHVLYGLHVASSYLLMLAAMTFNVGVFVAVCSGMGVGHWLFQAPRPEQSRGADNLADACCAEHF